MFEDLIKDKKTFEDSIKDKVKKIIIPKLIADIVDVQPMPDMSKGFYYTPYIPMIVIDCEGKTLSEVYENVQKAIRG